jgi:hypothetical protein
MSANIKKIVEKRIKAIVETTAMIMFSVNRRGFFVTKLFKSSESVVVLGADDVTSSVSGLRNAGLTLNIG